MEKKIEKKTVDSSGNGEFIIVLRPLGHPPHPTASGTEKAKATRRKDVKKKKKAESVKKEKGIKKEDTSDKPM